MVEISLTYINFFNSDKLWRIFSLFSSWHEFKLMTYAYIIAMIILKCLH